MQRNKQACPYEPANRAERCEGCVDAHGGVTPCVAAWLRTDGRWKTTNVIPLFSEERKAA